MSYQISEEDIEILCSQTDIDKKKAQKILKINKGDIVQSIIDIQENKDFSNLFSDNNKENIDDIEEDINLSNQKNLFDYREIVDEKDTLYQTNQEKKEQKQKEPPKNLCNEEKYYIKRQKEGKINIIHVL
tara:strand:+ start:600 stop:989 length:390 start_codon:yes stop_codon:yes gene_type:complete